MHLLLNNWMQQLQTLHVHGSHDVEGTLVGFHVTSTLRLKCQILYFLINTSPPKPLDVRAATSNFAGPYRPHDAGGTLATFCVTLTQMSRLNWGHC